LGGNLFRTAALLLSATEETEVNKVNPEINFFFQALLLVYQASANPQSAAASCCKFFTEDYGSYA